jgi:RNA polymerase sigma-70 factor, ECF subfamily
VIGQGSVLPFTAEREVVDRDLCRRITDREDSALGELYDRYGDLLYGFVVRLLRSVDDAEQLVQDHFLNFWNSPQRYPENRGTLYAQFVASLRAQVVGRLSAKGQRRTGRVPVVTVPSLVPEQSESLRVTSAISEDIVSSLIGALRKLSAEQQQVLALGYFDGFRISDISEHLSVPSDRVVMALHEAVIIIGSVFMNPAVESASAHPVRYDSLCTVFALDILDGNPRRDLEAHLRSGCVRCSDRISLLREIAALLPSVLPQVRPSAELRDRILFSSRLAQVAKSHYETSDRPSAIPPRTAAPESGRSADHLPAHESSGKYFRMISLIVAGVIIVAMAMYINQLHSVINEKEEYEKTLEKKVFVGQTQPPSVDSFSQVLSAPHLSVLRLNGMGSRIIESGRVVWSPEVHSAVVSLVNLPAPANGQSYRLWFVQNKELHPGPMMSCTVNQKDGSCSAYQKIDFPGQISEISGMGITRETEGEAGQSGGKIVLFGRF